MKKIAAVSVVALLVCVAGTGMPVRVSVPVPAYADGEARAGGAVPLPDPEERMLKITLAFEASPTNNVEFALSLGDDEEVIVGWDCGEWFARGGHLLEGWITAPASNPTAAGPRVLTLAVRFARKTSMPITFTLDADGTPVGFEEPEQETLLGWLARLGLQQPLEVAVTSRGCAGGAEMKATFDREPLLIIVR